MIDSRFCFLAIRYPSFNAVNVFTLLFTPKPGNHVHLGMRMPRIAVVHNWRNKVNVSGRYPLHIRIRLGTEPAMYAPILTPEKVRLDEWNNRENVWVKASHTYAFEINNEIRDKLEIIRDLIKKCVAFKKPITMEAIRSRLTRKGDTNSFYEFMAAYIRNPPETLEENTLKKYRTALTHLRAFREKLYFFDIDNAFIKAFHKFMQIELHLEGAACKKYMEAFKKVIRQAGKDNYIDPSQMELLFDNVKIKVPKAKRTFLQPAEIKALKQLTFASGQEHLQRDRDLFLFMIYTGYYYKDLRIFTKEQIIHDLEFGAIILGARDKNGNQTIVPIFKFPYAATILATYQAHRTSKTVFDSRHLIEEPVFNRHLKELGRLAHIEKSISNKTARHTNAQLWVRYGAEAPVLSKMLGHTKGETTKNYYDVGVPEIIEGIKRVDFIKLEIA